MKVAVLFFNQDRDRSTNNQQGENDMENTAFATRELKAELKEENTRKVLFLTENDYILTQTAFNEDHFYSDNSNSPEVVAWAEARKEKGLKDLEESGMLF